MLLLLLIQYDEGSCPWLFLRYTWRRLLRFKRESRLVWSGYNSDALIVTEFSSGFWGLVNRYDKSDVRCYTKRKCYTLTFDQPNCCIIDHLCSCATLDFETIFKISFEALLAQTGFTNARIKKFISLMNSTKYR